MCKVLLVFVDFLFHSDRQVYFLTISVFHKTDKPIPEIENKKPRKKVSRYFLTKGNLVLKLIFQLMKVHIFLVSQKEKLSGLDIEFVEGDLSNMEDVRTAVHGVDIIFHLGAAFQAGGPFSSEQYFDINVKGTFNILESSCESKIPIKHLIITSTDATMAKYPEKGILEPISENSLPLSTTDWYGYSKILCEHLANRYYRHKKC